MVGAQYYPQPQIRTKQGLMKGILELSWDFFWVWADMAQVVLGSIVGASSTTTWWSHIPSVRYTKYLELRLRPLYIHIMIELQGFR